MSEWPRILNDDGTVRLEQTQPPNSFLVVKRNADNSEVVSAPCVTTEPKDEIVRLLVGALAKARRQAGETPAEGLTWTDDKLREVVEAAAPYFYRRGEARYSTGHIDYKAMRAVLLAARPPQVE